LVILWSVVDSSTSVSKSEDSNQNKHVICERRQWLISHVRFDC
jgi:hypothetical protein